MVLLSALPLFGYGRMRKFGHFFGVLVIMTLLILVGMLTLFALRDDAPNGILWGMIKNNNPDDIKKAEDFQESVHEAEAKAKRACQLAMDGTPVEGGHVLLRHDPFTAGKKLFQQKCGSCHSFTKHGDDAFEDWIPKDKDKKNIPTASDLGNFGTKEWVRSLLKNPMDDRHFGLVKKIVKDANGKDVERHAMIGMRNWRTRIDKAREKWDDKAIAKQEEDFDMIAAWLDDQRKPKDHPDPKKRPDEELAKHGKAAFAVKANRCFECHTVEPDKRGMMTTGFEEGQGPDLTNYGTAEWLRGMIMRPDTTADTAKITACRRSATRKAPAPNWRCKNSLRPTARRK